MYNEELKERYIEEKTNEVVIDDVALNKLFEKTERWELENGKDVHSFTFYEIQEFYKMQNMSSFDSLKIMNSRLSMYTQWCLSQNLVLDNQNHFLEMDNEILTECLNKVKVKNRVVTEQMILHFVSRLENPRDKYVLLGSFEGLRGENFCELLKLKPSDVEGNVVTLCTGRKITVSNTLIRIIDECVNTDDYVAMSGNNNKVVNLIDNGYVFKNYPNVKNDDDDYRAGRNLYTSFRRIINNLDLPPYITLNCLYDSGKLHMVKQRAKELGISDTEYIMSSNISEVEEKYNCIIVRSIFLQKYKDYLE